MAKHAAPEIEGGAGHGVRSPMPTAEYQSLIKRVSRFIVCEQVPGDYLEFGVFQGATIVSAVRAFEENFRDRMSMRVGGRREVGHRAARGKQWSDMRFFAFDSFQGLPQLEPGDAGSEDFAAGAYACSLEEFSVNLERSGVDTKKVIAVEGWYSDTCSPETINRYRIEKASVVWVDCDLYSSTKIVLGFVAPLIQDGTVLVFDDWFSYKGSPFRGEQRAFNEWRHGAELSARFCFHEYQREGWKRNSFIATRR